LHVTLVNTKNFSVFDNLLAIYFCNFFLICWQIIYDFVNTLQNFSGKAVKKNFGFNNLSIMMSQSSCWWQRALRINGDVIIVVLANRSMSQMHCGGKRSGILNKDINSNYSKTFLVLLLPLHHFRRFILRPMML